MPNGGNIIELKTRIIIGSGQTSSEWGKVAQDQNQKDDAHGWWFRSCADNCKVTQSLAQKRGEGFNWDRCHYKCVADEPAKK